MDKKILFLDDEPVRHHWADENWSGDIVTHVFNVDQFFYELLRKERWDLISLDHDLGISDGRFINSGMKAVYFMEKFRVTAHDVIVHTINPPAGDRMILALKKLGYRVHRLPFDSTTKISWKGE